MPYMLKMSNARCVLQERTRTFEVINLSTDNVLSGKVLCRYNSRSHTRVILASKVGKQRLVQALRKFLCGNLNG